MSPWFKDGVLTDEAVQAHERVRAERLIRPAWACMPIAGGIACRGTRLPWLNVCVGMGLTQEITPADVQRLVSWYDEHGVDGRVELADRVDPRALTVLGQAGFRIASLISVIALTLDDGQLEVPPACSTGIQVRRVDPADAQTTQDLAEVVTRGFASQAEPPREHLEANIAAARSRGGHAFAAFADGKVIGGGFLDCLGGVASLWGAAVAPSHRCQGAQSALIAHRLRAAAEAGASLACVETASGGPTHRNASRFGFRLAYTRAVLCRDRSSTPPPASTGGTAIPTIST